MSFYALEVSDGIILLCLEHGLKLLYSHESMRKADFAAIDNAIACCFYQGEDVVVAGVFEEALEGGLEDVLVNAEGAWCCC